MLQKHLKKKIFTGCFLGSAKAFDKIDHSILLYKLHHYGVRGLPYEWLKRYLSNRSLQTEINGKLSPPTLINLGVRHGSILGSLLKCLTSGQAIMFADDTNLFFENISYTQLRYLKRQMRNCTKLIPGLL